MKVIAKVESQSESFTPSILPILFADGTPPPH